MLRNRLMAHYFFILGIAFLFYPRDLFAQEDFIYDAKGKRNPFIPLVTDNGMLMQLDKEEEKSGELKVEGIIYAKDGRSFAIINGEVVGIGDYVDNYRILRIEDGKVILIKDGQSKEIELEKEEK
ncbi:MAG: general secretion pathway protein GspB [Candidatus Omnitrophica bacterium]|nr:general secretion pathway protein GspB [Candidatus Omnitrophota bacterium]